MAKVTVNLTEEDGTVLDRFTITVDDIPGWNEVKIAAEIRETIEQDWNVED